VSVVLPAEEGRGPREVADPNFVPSSFETCGSAGLLAWKSAALADLGSFRNALIKQKQDYRQRREDISRIEVRLSTVLTHTHSHTHTHAHAQTHTHTHSHSHTHTHTHIHSASSLFHASTWNVVVRVCVCLSVFLFTCQSPDGRKDSQSVK
jgi:hypothetical protein